jgi:hypothetical protein
MPVYLVSYDIPEGNPSYAKVVECLEKELKAKRVLKSQWLLIHEGDSNAILRKFKGIKTGSDSLIVQKVATRDFAWENPILPEEDLATLLFCEVDD